MQVIRYIAGFVPFSLIKKYKKMKSEQGKNYASLLKVWQVNNEETIIAPSFLTYTVTWLNLQNRGGLFKVNDDVFRFFLSMEKVSGRLLRKDQLRTMSSTNVSETMMEQLQANNHVTAWDNITSTCTFSTKTLFVAVLKKWINIWINAFVKAINILTKKKKQASKKGEKSLRKELAK